MEKFSRTLSGRVAWALAANHSGGSIAKENASELESGLIGVFSNGKLRGAAYYSGWSARLARETGQSAEVETKTQVLSSLERTKRMAAVVKRLEKGKLECG